MRMTISEFLEHVDRALPRSRYRLYAAERAAPESARLRRAGVSPGYVVSVSDDRTGKRYEFLVARDDLATDARGEWQASVVARAVKELSAQPQRGVSP